MKEVIDELKEELKDVSLTAVSNKRFWRKLCTRINTKDGYFT